jgi:hypothetical protein
MKLLAALLCLPTALATVACTSTGGTGSAIERFNAPPTYEGPGCYDHKNRLERTIRTQAECAAAAWVWKP